MQNTHLHALALAGYARDEDDVPIRFQLHPIPFPYPASSSAFLPVIVPSAIVSVFAFVFGFGFIWCPSSSCSSSLARKTLEELARALPGRPPLFPGWDAEMWRCGTWIWMLPHFTWRLVFPAKVQLRLLMARFRCLFSSKLGLIEGIVVAEELSGVWVVSRWICGYFGWLWRDLWNIHGF